MSRQTETARKDARTAGKTAKKQAAWHEARCKDGRIAYRSPSGWRKIYGTAAEVRKAKMPQVERDDLARCLMAERRKWLDGVHPQGLYIELAARDRRDAILFSMMPQKPGNVKTLTEMKRYLNPAAREVCNG